jgi:hypothetical protein
MNAGATLAAMVLASGGISNPVPSAPRPRAAVVAAPGCGAGCLTAARAQAADRFELPPLDPELQRLLEGGQRPRSPEERTKEALTNAKEQLRRFDLLAARITLDAAWAVAEGLPPTREGREIVVEVAIRDAELALVAGDSPRAIEAMQLALSVDAQLQLDPTRYSPTLLRTLERARASRERALPSTLSLATEPNGAHVSTSGADRCTTPCRLDLLEGQHLLWLQLDGYAPKMIRLKLPTQARPVSLDKLPAPVQTASLIDALLRARGPQRESLATELARGLGVDELILAEPGGVTAALPSLQKLPDSGPPPPEQQGRSPWLRGSGWALVAVAAGLCAGAIYAGFTARSTYQQAISAHFAFDGAQLGSQASEAARTANWLYVGAGVGALAGGALIVF